MNTLAPITLDESKRLLALEGVIKAGLSNFIEVGNALAEIRDAKLYRPLETFEEYCVSKWNFTDRHARNFINAAKVSAALSEIGTTVPVVESQARPLTKLETPEQQREAWSAAVEAADGQPTAKQVDAAVEEVKARAVEAEIIPPEGKPPKYQPSDALMYADNAISQLAKIQRNDTQRSRAFAKIAKYIADNQ